ncbi:MYB-like transcription factor EOBII [Phragmites australis]|uniref:MYB-like transcription factor EOBII n=1 Tax=Phragmites australis TaxID=29695 RepID=UPI002D7690D5|nr:MYB-like transcription factor EOBII [Phragmites australis]
MEFARINNVGECVRAEAAAVRKGPWTVEEDILLMSYIALNGDGGWNNLARAAGLNRTGKSCRLRWLNYLRPGIRHGNFTPEEHALVVELQSRWGNRWSKIARHLPGRTDNEVKNFWRTKIQKKRKPCSDGVTDAIAAELATTYSQASTSMSQESCSTLLHGGLISSTHVDVAVEPSLLYWDHHQSFSSVNGAGAGPMTALPELVAAESSDNFSWAFEDVWPVPLQSLNFSF